ncbi:hypothetical protein [Brevibacterium renqingii]|uniref:hypothetical protein n=1 Tax=Brevibacterium renqingii TaxID=2776916 RepID=UPI001ADFFFCC|nr:hypothetical protein [Brevibacterium renqingii]
MAAKLLRRGGAGAGKGIAATTAMSAVLAAAEVSGFVDRQPPRIIIEKILPDLSDSSVNFTASLAHVAYGTSAGVAYSTLVPLRWQNRATGVAFGAAIWALGYEGWLPALGILPPAHRDRPGRAVAVLAAHLVYGWRLGSGNRESCQRES